MKYLPQEVQGPGFHCQHSKKKKKIDSLVTTSENKETITIKLF